MFSGSFIFTEPGDGRVLKQGCVLGRLRYVEENFQYLNDVNRF